jgi:acyl carrier protein
MYAQITTTLQEEIASFLALEPSEIDPQMPLFEMGVDSLQTLQLLVLLERNFSIHMDESDLQHFKTVHSIATLAVERLDATNSPIPALLPGPAFAPAVN